MTQAELKTVLDGSGIPFVYRAWKNGHDLPFGVFYFERDNPFAADGIVYAKKTLYALELYTAEKDPDAEAALEKALLRRASFTASPMKPTLTKNRCSMSSMKLRCKNV